MSPSPLKEIQARIELAFTELGCKIPVVLENDELIIRDLVIYEDADETFVVEASKPETPLFRLETSALNDIAASVAIHVCKGVVTRAIARNYG
ncbi:hypothetical protein [Rhizobium sp. MHM7A]|uniref:hypothetical protein n=1 Tax=Rhizobium sp. MHM7A TaxID=2583233 RepID=UPI001105B87E|nr:hypothetical protein [Rhizobium sp. MHM7A]TLX16993.1 hypothetical protein FFR93_06645 [Rhizobium sp. MHM7A]